MNIVFLAPGFLWLALLAPVVWFVPARARDKTQAALRSLVILLLAIGLARPVVWRADEREHSVFVADLSASVAPESRARALAALGDAARILPRDAITTLVLIGDAEAPAGFERVERLASKDAALAERGSPLSAALDLAARSIPVGTRGSVTLVTDGLATDRRFASALIDLEERGIPVHTVQLASRRGTVEPARLESLGQLRVGHTSSIALELAGDAKDALVTLLGPGGEIGRREHQTCETRGRVVFDYEPATEGFVTLEARVEEAGRVSTLKSTFAVQRPFRVLYFGGRIAESKQKLSALIGPGFELESPSVSDAEKPLKLDGYDLALIDDARADSIPAETQQLIATSVVDRGIGLVMSGGESAFGPGGWAESPLAAVLPVECVQKEEKRDPSTTLALIIDTSGSMGGERIQLAKEVARLAMSRLLPHDKVGIVEFYGTKRWAAPIQSAANTIELQRAINRMDAGGGTIIMPAIEEAFYGMQNVQTRYKHVLILTDGGVETGAFEPLLRHMAEEGMNVSTVLIGPEAHSEFLVNIANWGKGRFYSVPDRFNLPEILLKQPTSTRLPGYKPGSFPVVTRGGSGWWGSVDRSKLAPLAGYVESNARPGAEVLIETDGDHHPILATWNHGLGRATALLTEPVGPGTEPWRAWKDYGRFLARVLARTAEDSSTPFRFALERRGDELTVVAERRRPGTEEPRAHEVDPRGDAGREFAFRARADGLYTSTVFAPRDREVRIVGTTAGDNTASGVRVVSNARADEIAELAVDPAEALDLARVAHATNGDEIALGMLATTTPRAGGAQAPQRLAALAPFAFALALLLYLLEVFHRRRDRRVAA
jgi:Ca-activated chloride channel homolog